MKSGISTHLEFAVVLIEAVLLVGFAIPLWAKRVNRISARQGRDPCSRHRSAVQLEFPSAWTGWPFRAARRRSLLPIQIRLDSIPNDPAAKDDIVVLGELHVPVNRPVIIEFSSKDVIHNFALPNMRIAQDAIPGSDHSDVVHSRSRPAPTK